MKILKNWLRRRSPENHAWLRDPENWNGVRELPQVAVPARLVVTPNKNLDEDVSYIGGDPYLPPDAAWPTSDQTPMAFIMQINCSELPKELWGRIGPRQGYLSFFMAWDRATPAVLFHESRGVLRRHPEMPKPQWRRRDVKGPRAALEIVAWPTVYAERDEAIACPTTCMEHAEQMMPLTWGQAVTLLEGLANNLGLARFSKSTDTQRSIVHPASDPLLPGQEIGRETQIQKQELLRLASVPVLNLLRIARKKSGKESLTKSDHEHIFGVLANTHTPAGKVVQLRPGRKILGYRVEYSDGETIYPQTLGGLRNLYADSARLWSKLKEEASRHCRTIEAQLDWCKSAADYSPPEGVPDYDRAELDRVTQVLRTELAAMKAFENEAKDCVDWHTGVQRKFTSVVEGGFKSCDNRPVPDGLLETIRELRAISKPELSSYGLSDAFYEITKIDCTLVPVLDDSGYAFQDWAKEWHRTAALLALEDPLLLPEPIKPQFMNWLCLKLAKQPHQMGGIPDHRVHLGESWFDPGHFVHERELEVWLSNDDGTTRIYLSECEPPFDKENALLLNLYSEELLDWYWGDLYTVALAVPREALREGDWSSVEAVITN